VNATQIDYDGVNYHNTAAPYTISHRINSTNQSAPNSHRRTVYKATESNFLVHKITLASHSNSSLYIYLNVLGRSNNHMFFNLRARVTFGEKIDDYLVLKQISQNYYTLELNATSGIKPFFVNFVDLF